jgi:hypothetical protein
MMRCDPRVVFIALALSLASCQGSGLDSGMGGMGGMTPPVSEGGGMGGGLPGQMGGNGMQGAMAGPSTGPNGQEQLAPNVGATLAPNVAQYPLAQGPSGMKCPTVTQFNTQYGCTLAFNIPAPSASGSPKPTASPTPTPQPSASSDDDSSDDSDASPTATPAGGTMTLQVEPLPKDVPSMNNPNPLLMRVAPVVAVRLQSNMDFQLNGGASVQYTLPSVQYSGRTFVLQLFNETTFRGKRADQYIGSYAKYTTPQSNTVNFAFTLPRGVSVRHTQVWLLALYGATLPPGSTPTPSASPSPAPTSSGSASP